MPRKPSESSLKRGGNRKTRPPKQVGAGDGKARAGGLKREVRPDQFTRTPDKLPGLPNQVVEAVRVSMDSLPSAVDMDKLLVPLAMTADIGATYIDESLVREVDDQLDKADIRDLERYANSTESVPLLREKARVMLAIYERARASRGERYLSPTAQMVKQRLFLDAYVGGKSTISAACKAAGVATTTLYQWLAEDAVFARDYCDAREQAVDQLVMEARRRAVDGVDRAVGWYQGVPGGTEKQYSDSLLAMLLKGMRPDVFDTTVRAAQLNQVNTATGANNAANSASIPFERMSSEAQLAILAIIEKELGVTPIDVEATVSDEGVAT